MGTSKGYIAPKTIHWSQTKRAVTSYINHGDSESKMKAASRFATAMKHDMESTNNFTKASAKVLLFANAVTNSGLNQALFDLGRKDLIGKDSETILNELLQDFTNCGSTTEDYLSAEAIASALKELQITDMEELKDVSCEQLLKEMIIEYVKLSFAFRYEEKIRMKKSPAETKKLLSEMNKYISNELHEKLSFDDLKVVDFSNLRATELVKDALKDAYQVFELFYEEAE